MAAIVTIVLSACGVTWISEAEFVSTFEYAVPLRYTSPENDLPMIHPEIKGVGISDGVDKPHQGLTGRRASGVAATTALAAVSRNDA